MLIGERHEIIGQRNVEVVSQKIDKLRCRCMCVGAFSRDLGFELLSKLLKKGTVFQSLPVFCFPRFSNIALELETLVTQVPRCSGLTSRVINRDGAKTTSRFAPSASVTQHTQ
jgi:hypothetical protein